MKNIIIYGIILGFLASCSDVKKLTAPEYLNYVVEHESEFKVTNSANGVKYNVVYTTLDELMAEQMTDETTDLESLKKIRVEEKKSPNAMFQLCIEVQSGTLFTQHKEDPSVQMKYYAVEFKKSIKAVTSVNDTIDCQNYIFQSNAGFGTKSYMDFQFATGISSITKILINPQYLTESVIEIDLTPLKHTYPELIIK